MKSILIIYYSDGGHTARISRYIAEHLQFIGHKATTMHINEAFDTNILWENFDTIVIGSCVLYGTYPNSLIKFVNLNNDILNKKLNSFFCVNLVARDPNKCITENSKSLQKFLLLSDWQPKNLKVVAGKVNYPAWKWYDRLIIRLIMKITNGPTDPKSIIDYTNWDDLNLYAENIASLE